MKTHHSIKPTYLIILLAFILLALGLLLGHFNHSGPVVSNQKIKVLAAENFWGNITTQIGGDKVIVTSIMSDPHTDPHLYESDAHAAAAIAEANLVIKNGLGYDSFVDKLLTAAPKKDRQVLAVEKILNISGEDPNPHLWYDLPRVPEVASAIEQALAAKDPADSAIFAANLTYFRDSLKPLLSVIAEINAKYPHAPVAYTERVPGYVLAAAGLDVKTPPGFAAAIEQGNDPNPQDTATMEALMKHHAVQVLLYNSQATSAVTQHIRDLANQAGVPIIGVTETLPPSESTYQSWQFNQLKALLHALGG